VLVLNARANAIIRVIWSWFNDWSNDAQGRRAFVTAERAWQKYVHYECVSRSRSWPSPAPPHQYVGGTSAPVRAGICQEKLTTAHIRELKETAAELGPH